MNNGNEIKFKSKKITLIFGLLLLIFAVLLEVVFIQGFREDGTDGIIAIAVLSVCFTGVMAICGIFGIYTYFANGKNIRKALKKYGEENIITNINHATIRIFRNPLTGAKVYFTDKFVIDLGEAIIDYNEISMMYKSVRKTRYAKIPAVAFALFDGNTYILCDNVEDAEIMNIMQLCYQHNSKILFGFTKENKEAHQKKVKRYKSGESNLPEVNCRWDVLRTNQEADNNKICKIKDYIFKNYIPEQKADAIKYYQDMTGAGFAEADTAVETIFEERKRSGMVLTTPRQWTPAGRKYESGRAMAFMGIAFVVVSVIFTVMLPLMMNHNLDVQINEVSENEREELLKEGCQEFRTVGRYVERDINYKFGDSKERHDLKNLYIFELEDGTYLGISSKNDLQFLNESSGAGYDIFYDGEVLRDVIERTEATYDTVVVDVNDIAAVYGIPSEDSLLRKKLTVFMSLMLFVPIMIVGVIFIIKGCRKMKR